MNVFIRIGIIKSMYLLLVTGLFSSTCQGEENWFATKISTPSTYYFYGEGKKIAQARAMALTDLTQQLNVSIKSETRINMVKEQASVITDRTEFDARITAAELSLPAVNWFNSDLKNSRFRVGGELSVKALSDWLIQDFTQIEAKLNLITNRESLSYYLFLQKNSEILTRANNTAKVLTHLCQQYCDSAPYKRWLAQYAKHLSIPQRTCILVDQDSREDITPFLADMLVENGFSQNAILGDDTKCYLLSATLRKTFTRQDKIKHVNGSLTLSLSSDNKVIAANKLTLSAQSTTSYSQALASALNELFTAKQNSLSLLTIKN